MGPCDGLVTCPECPELGLAPAPPPPSQEIAVKIMDGWIKWLINI